MKSHRKKLVWHFCFVSVGGYSEFHSLEIAHCVFFFMCVFILKQASWSSTWMMTLQSCRSFPGGVAHCLILPHWLLRTVTAVRVATQGCQDARCLLFYDRILPMYFWFVGPGGGGGGVNLPDIWGRGLHLETWRAVCGTGAAVRPSPFQQKGWILIFI